MVYLQRNGFFFGGGGLLNLYEQFGSDWDNVLVTFKRQLFGPQMESLNKKDSDCCLKVSNIN